MRLQKLVAAMAMTGALGSGMANALGLGEVRLNSALNQPLDAEIELLQVRDLTRNEILPNLASRSDFQRAGVERPFSLTDLKFKTVIRPNGTGFIHVTSSNVIREPFLNMLLEVHWPSGRLLREYTMLLDPPTFSEQPAQPVGPATTPGYNAGLPAASQSRNANPFDQRTAAGGQPYQPQTTPVDTQTVQRSGQQQQGVRTQPAYASSSQAGDYQVQNNDNLWTIARSIRPGSDLSVQQTMLAIQRKNPEAFIQSNINRLKKGQVLRVPERNEIESIGFQEAISEVARQNREWHARLEQLDAARRSAPEKAASGNAADGKLSIVGTDSVSGQGQDLGGGSNDAENAALQNELAMTREKLDKISRENAELKSRLKDLDDQISTLKRLITLKDDQMAALQQGEPAPETVEQPVEAKPVVQPAPAPAPQPQPGFLDFLFSNPLMLALAGLIPLGLIAALLVYRRRKASEEEAELDDDLVESVPLVPATEEVEENEELELDETLEIDEASLDEEESFEETTQQTEDAISEADIYIAYGRFPQAAELLGKAIRSESERTDLRLKLLEVHAENNDLDNFKEALSGLEQLGDQGAIRQADVFKARFPADAFADSPAPASSDEDLDDFDLDEVLGESTEDESSEAGLDDLEFDLDDLDFGDEDDDARPVVEGASESEEEAIDFQLDDLGLDDGTEESAQELPDLDLGDLELDETEGADSIDDLDLDDLDIDLGDDEASASSSSSETLDFEDGLPDLESALGEDDLDFLSEDDEVATKLDLARAYIDMGDKEGARDILQEVLEAGTDEQKQEAQALLEQAG